MSEEKKTLLDEARETINRVDREMAHLFEERMDAVRKVAEYKIAHGLQVLDAEREKQVIERNSALIEDEALRAYYIEFLKNNMAVSRRFQHNIMPNEHNVIPVRLGNDSYDITVCRGAIDLAAEKIMKKDRKVCVVTDSGVPKEYSDKLLTALGDGAILHVIPAGEENKTFESLLGVLREMLDAGFARTDAVVALGGGVVGDLAGFAAATYMRGIDFYNIPTTLLAQVDSSVGGKTAVDLDGYKNMIGAFHQPRAVFIDPDLLATLPLRHISAGLCEALKMGATSDPVLFELFEKGNVLASPKLIEEIIVRAVKAKRDVVEIDEREGGLRKVLNFGHTLGHAIESVSGLSLLHGECVALGMIPMCENEEFKKRLAKALSNIGLSTDITKYSANKKAILEALTHDKKSAAGGKISAVLLRDIGEFEFISLTPEEIIERLV
ncbi:MAG: 3-dehydroquinate synthase [Clostridia bacterium]|nr:3-dehydroquinate synthase [Clostridia bacterium]